MQYRLLSDLPPAEQRRLMRLTRQAEDYLVRQGYAKIASYNPPSVFSAGPVDDDIALAPVAINTETLTEEKFYGVVYKDVIIAFRKA